MLAHAFSLNQFNPRNFLIWCLLAFQAGAINAGGWLSCHRFVSHITGFSTHFGVELASGQVASGFYIMSVPLFFLVGAMTSAFFIDRRVSQNKAPFYTAVIGGVGFLMLLVTILGSIGHFGTFGTPLNLSVDYELLGLLCLACGMQNAAVTSASGAVIRTTHLTGITTDLGIGLVRTFSSHLPEDVRRLEIRKNRIRMGLFAAFTFGAASGSFLFVLAGYLGFLFPASISLILAGIGLYYRRSTPRLAAPSSIALGGSVD